MTYHFTYSALCFELIFVGNSPEINAEPSARSTDSDVIGEPSLVLFVDVEKKLEKHKELLDKEINKSNKELKRILKNLGANYKKSVELAQSLLTDIVDIWSRIEDTSKDADPISDGPDSYNLADLLLLAKFVITHKILDHINLKYY